MERIYVFLLKEAGERAGGGRRFPETQINPEE